MTGSLVITGATGLVGRALISQTQNPVVLTRDTRRTAKSLPGVAAHTWHPREEPAPVAALAGAEAVVHLAGEPVAEGRWTDAKKARIRDSRVEGTQRLVQGIAALDPQVRPGVLVSASAVGYYGSRGDTWLDEGAAPGEGFLPEVCLAWEREARAAEDLGLRVVCIRIGIVLARDGGALSRMVPPFKAGIGGRIGDGEQWMPWIHLEDLVGLIEHALTTDSVSGPMNAASPNPATNADFTRALADALHRPAFLPVPKLALRVVFGEMSEVLFASQRVEPAVALASGYRFRYPLLKEALGALFKEERKAA